jgi:hypothetical protein
MSSLPVFNRVYRLEIQSVMLVFSTGFVNFCRYICLSGSPPPPLPSPHLPKVKDSMCLGEGGEVLSCVGDHILQSVSDQNQNLQNCYPKPPQTIT